MRRAAVTALLRAIDESKSKNAQAADDESAAEALPLLEELKAAWNLHSLDEFLRTANSNPDFAALFPAILDAADTGNALAQRVLAQAADELAQLAGIVVRRLFAEGEGNSLGVRCSAA